jgi:hypothetical protein
VALGIELLAENPAEGLAELEATTAGCRWLVEQWQALDQAFTASGCWSSDDLAQATALVGLDPLAPHADQEIAMRLRLVYLAFLPKIDFDAADRLLAINTTHLVADARRAEYDEIVPTRDEARAVFRSLAESEVARLETHSKQIEDAVEQPELSALLHEADVDSSPDGMRLARYDAMNELAFHRNWNAFQRLRRYGAEALGLEPTPPAELLAASAQNEPIEDLASLDEFNSYVSTDKRAEAVSECSAEHPTAAEPPFEAVLPHHSPVAEHFEPAELAALSA